MCEIVECVVVRPGSVQNDRLVHQRREAAQVFVDLLFGGFAFDQRLDTFLEALCERTFDEDFLAGELVDDFVASAGEAVGGSHEGRVCGHVEHNDRKTVRVVEHLHQVLLWEGT